MNKKLFSHSRNGLRRLVLVSLSALAAPHVQAAMEIAQWPLFLGGSSTPLVMLVMGRDHKLYYEAYNDASDLNADGVLDTVYKPNEIDYFGLFDSFLCYSYGSDKFTSISKAAKTGTAKKQCSGSWSGDFLNYLTTSRMDALRKVLYGGYRIPASDTATGTVLERSYIPQDAHSWGKEYYSVAHDGYDISKYAPLALPVSGTHHLFANTTLLNDSAQKPLLRVLPNSKKRIWEWVSKERPVAGSDCIGGSCEANGGTDNTRPADHAAFIKLLEQFATPGHLLGTSATSTPAPDFTLNGRIECSSNCNPYGTDDYYITVFRGTLNIVTEGDYQFSLKGDDATEVLIDNELVFIRPSYNFCTEKTTGCIGTKYLSAGSHIIEYHHEEGNGDDSYYLYWKGADSKDKNWEVVPTGKFSNLVISTYDRKTADSKIADYTVRVDACVKEYREENNPDASEYCRGYPAEKPTIYKPAGLLQQYSEDEPERMAFGLLSGSYKKNTSGGVLRKNIGPFSKKGDSGNEVDRDTGVFSTSVKGIVNTLDNFKIVGFGGDYEYGKVDGKKCGWITDRPIEEGECRMWGNPIAEMMYESLRYFAEQPSTSAPKPTTAYDYSDTTDATVPLPKADWKYPFRAVKDGGYSGAKCFMLAISDINPSFDTDQIPGTTFTGSVDSTLPGLNVATEAATIWSNEEKVNPAFIGHSLDNTPPYDGAPTPKTVTSLGRIRGLSPEEPTKQGGYYSASVAFFGNAKGIGGTPGKQPVKTMSVVLASPLPRIEIPVGTSKPQRYVTLVPFAKSVGGGYGIDPAPGKFQPTNQIVDFYVNTINYTDSSNGGRPHGIFQINYEDVEQGADHDMDAIVVYEYWVLEDGNVKVKLDSTYAAGGIIQHMGYVIAGTDGQDGVYLEVRDKDTTSGDPDYYLDTPVETTTDTGVDGGMTKKRSAWGSTAYQSSGMLPLTSTRLFRPSSSITATASFIKNDPLWYAAKWGGFNDLNNNGLPDSEEWDSKIKGKPDNYYLVTNAGLLKKQLSAAFEAIKETTGTASAVAVATGKAYGDGDLYQAQFDSKDWSGKLVASQPATKATGTVEQVIKWDAGAGKKINEQPSSRKLVTYKPSASGGEGILFDWNEIDPVQQQVLSLDEGGNYDTKAQDRLNFLRGDKTQEEGKPAAIFRKRSSNLGDIVNSNPVYVSLPLMRYDMECVSEKYSGDAKSFREKNAARNRMIYVGSNDGMLHGFNAGSKDLISGDGEEEFAYVPSVVFSNLSRLTWQSYNTVPGETDPSVGGLYNSKHRYYVDSTSIVSDACLKTGWGSVLVGRLGAGGRGVFALDVTDPLAFDKTKVLWEFTAANDADLGYTFGGSWIVQMNNGKWAVVFGNGYNSDEATGLCDDGLPVGEGCDKDERDAKLIPAGSGNAVLFIVDVNTGAVIKKLPVPALCSDGKPVGTGCTSPATPISSVGLSSPNVYDVDGDGKMDWIYAGDMAGHLWKFDVRSSNTLDWAVKLLFTAKMFDLTKKDDGVPQPISSAPVVMKHPEGGTLILFGTGRYLNNKDPADRDSDNPLDSVQSYYGIWDQEFRGVDRQWGTADDVAFTEVGPINTSDARKGTLRMQTFEKKDVSILGDSYRMSSANEICWTTPCEKLVCTLDEGCKDGEYKLIPEGIAYTLSARRGWVLDLPYPDLSPYATPTTASITASADRVTGSERVYDDSVQNGGRIIFVSKAFTSAKTAQPCEPIEPGAKSWLNIIDALSGKRLETSFLNVDKNDKTTAVRDGENAPSSLQVNALITGPSLSSGGGTTRVMVGTSGGGSGTTGGGGDTLKVEPSIINLAIENEDNWQSWKQLDVQGN